MTDEKRLERIREAAETILDNLGIEPCPRLRTGSDQTREALVGLLANIKMHHDGECPGITPADCLDAIYEAAEVARHALATPCAGQDSGALSESPGAAATARGDVVRESPPLAARDSGEVAAFSDAYCTRCGAGRLLRNGQPAQCSYIACPSPLYDLQRETGATASALSAVFVEVGEGEPTRDARDARVRRETIEACSRHLRSHEVHCRLGSKFGLALSLADDLDRMATPKGGSNG